jgi:predicted anti-sigma-YlaC factor YlaD
MEATRFEAGARQVARPGGPEVGCDVCFDELDCYLELEVACTAADSAIPGLRAHLDGCSACRERRAAFQLRGRARSGTSAAPQ